MIARDRKGCSHDKFCTSKFTIRPTVDQSREMDLTQMNEETQSLARLRSGEGSGEAQGQQNEGCGARNGFWEKE